MRGTLGVLLASVVVASGCSVGGPSTSPEAPFVEEATDAPATEAAAEERVEGGPPGPEPTVTKDEHAERPPPPALGAPLTDEEHEQLDAIMELVDAARLLDQLALQRRMAVEQDEYEDAPSDGEREEVLEVLRIVVSWSAQVGAGSQSDLERRCRERSVGTCLHEAKKAAAAVLERVISQLPKGTLRAHLECRSALFGAERSFVWAAYLAQMRVEEEELAVDFEDAAEFDRGQDIIDSLEECDDAQSRSSPPCREAREALAAEFGDRGRSWWQAIESASDPDARSAAIASAVSEVQAIVDSELGSEDDYIEHLAEEAAAIASVAGFLEDEDLDGALAASVPLQGSADARRPLEHLARARDLCALRDP
jgi:hypothetical protein